MSMISFYFLLLFLICISFHHPCHSQCLQLDHNKFQNQLQAAPIKCKIGKMVISREEAAIECMKLSSPKPAEEEESFRSKRQKYKRRRKQLIKRLTREFEKVSWKVPHDDDNDDHKKVIGNDGVFSSDYEHARTHPPSHN